MKKFVSIKVCKTADGYRGLTFSDRWNISVLKDFGLDINKLGFKAYRAAVSELGFMLSSVGAKPAVWQMTGTEVRAFGGLEHTTEEGNAGVLWVA